MKYPAISFPVFARIAVLAIATIAGIEAQGPPTMFPPVRGLHEMVGAANNMEVEAGYRVLTQGGKPATFSPRPGKSPLKAAKAATRRRAWMPWPAKSIK